MNFFQGKGVEGGENKLFCIVQVETRWEWK